MGFLINPTLMQSWLSLIPFVFVLICVWQKKTKWPTRLWICNSFCNPPILFKDASLHWFLSPCKHLCLSLLLCWPPGCCFELYRECLRRVFFYCKTCPEHIVSQRDLKDLSNQSQIMVHVRVSIPTPQELATGPRLLIAHIPPVWSVVRQPGVRMRFCLTPPTPGQTFTHTTPAVQ